MALQLGQLNVVDRHEFTPMQSSQASTAVQAPEWERQYAAKLDDANLKKGLKLFWFATGKDDGLITTTKATVELFEKHGFKPVFKESAGGHTWINWRAYLTEFVPQLFQPGAAKVGTTQASR